MRHPFKAALARGKKLVGLSLPMSNLSTAQIGATAGFKSMSVAGASAC